MSLDTLLTQLEQSRLIRQAADAEAASLSSAVATAYEFENALAQDTAYQSLLRSRRRAVHRRVAECFERLYPERLDEYAGLLAHHYAEAGNDAKALVYAERAGDVALQKYALAEAIAHFELGLGLAARLDAPEHLAALYTHRGRALELMGRHEHALHNYEQMQAAARATTDRDQHGGSQMELEALVRQTLLRSTANLLFDPEQAGQLAAMALAKARALGDSVAEARILWSQVNLYRFTNRNQQAREVGERAIAILRAQMERSTEPANHDLIEVQAFLLNDLGHVYTWTGYPDESMTTLRQAAGLWRQLDNRAMLTDNLATSGLYLALFGEIEAAAASAAEARTISDAIHNPWGQSYSRSSASLLHWYRGETGDAVAIMLDSIRFGEEAGYLVAQVLMRAYLALCYMDLGAIRQGLETARTGLNIAEERLQVLVPALAAVMAHLQLATGDHAAARAAVDELAGSDTDNPFVVDLVLGARSRVYLALGQIDGALAAGSQHVDYLRNHRFRLLLPWALHTYARSLLAAGQTETAAAKLAEALAEAETLGVRRESWCILATMAEMAAAAGDHAQVEVLRSQSRAQVAFLTDQIDAPDLRQSFLGRAEVRKVMAELL